MEFRKEQRDAVREREMDVWREDLRRRRDEWLKNVKVPETDK